MTTQVLHFSSTLLIVIALSALLRVLEVFFSHKTMQIRLVKMYSKRMASQHTTQCTYVTLHVTFYTMLP